MRSDREIGSCTVPHEYSTLAGEPGQGASRQTLANSIQSKSIELSGIRGIASRHGYRFEKIGVALFNLKADPGETKNLADQHPEIVRRLQAIVDEARADLGDARLTKQPARMSGPAATCVRIHPGQ